MKKVFTVLLIGISGLLISGCDWLFWDDLDSGYKWVAANIGPYEPVIE